MPAKVLNFLHFAMNNYPKLKFPAIRLRASRCGDEVRVWDGVRGKFLVLTPEEWVRRHLIEFLIVHRGVAPHSIVQEYAVPLNDTAQRADVVVVGADARPQMLVECKAPDVKIDGGVFAQAVRYNSVVGARYVVLTNGLTHYCYELTDGNYRQLSEFPTL